MTDRETVLHVAKLARLELTGEEVERMSAKVLGHIEVIEELDLGGVAPTSHVVDGVGASRPDEPSVRHAVALANAARPTPAALPAIAGMVARKEITREPGAAYWRQWSSPARTRLRSSSATASRR
jgi:aspartyl-tRNA(Asn)/glutamyl-tRNA(Gln) amidotransferase subunit C